VRTFLITSIKLFINKIKEEFKMKRLVLVALIAITTIGMNANVSNPDYVVTEDGVTFFNKVKYGFSYYLIGVKELSKKKKLKRDDITS